MFLKCNINHKNTTIVLEHYFLVLAKEVEPRH